MVDDLQDLWWKLIHRLSWQAWERPARGAKRWSNRTFQKKYSSIPKCEAPKYWTSSAGCWAKSSDKIAQFARIVNMYQIYLAGMDMPGRPIGNLLFLGPTGSGKTRVVEASAEILFGSPRAFIKIDCAEFQHSHEIAKLIGSPPGYLGHRETPPLLTQEAIDQYQTDEHVSASSCSMRSKKPTTRCGSCCWASLIKRRSRLETIAKSICRDA